MSKAGGGIEREPCPYRIIDDAGGAFGFGVTLGGIWHWFGGFRNAPKGKGFEQAWNRCKTRAPILGGSFAVWGTVFSIFDCSIASIRRKEDPWNAIISGALAGGVLAARGGIKAAGLNALAGGVILAAIEGLNIAVQRVIMPLIEKQQQDAAVLASGGMQTFKVDLLDPPYDPYSGYRQREPAFTSKYLDHSSPPPPPASVSLEPLPSSQTAGFTLDSINSFDTQTIETHARTQPENTAPWYKVW